MPDLPQYRELVAVRPALIELHNKIRRCQNLNSAFGFHLEPVDLDGSDRWPPELIDVAEAMIAADNAQPKKRR